MENEVRGDIAAHTMLTDELKEVRDIIKKVKSLLSVNPQVFERGLVYVTHNDQTKAVLLNETAVGGVLSSKEIIALLWLDGADLNERCNLRRTIVPHLVGKGPWVNVGPSDTLSLHEKGFLTVKIEHAAGGSRETYGWVMEWVGLLEKFEVMEQSRSDPAVICTEKVVRLCENIKAEYDSKVAGQLQNFLFSYTQPSWQCFGRRGVLFYGPPGTGKSRLCKWIADALLPGNKVLEHCTAADLNSRYIGESEQKIRDIVRPAKADCNVLFMVILEEVDTLAGDVDKKQGGGQDYKRDVLTVLLDAISENPNIIFIATTNFKNKLDERIIRSKRLGEHILVGTPSAQKRHDYFVKKIDNSFYCTADVMALLVRLTRSFAYSQLESVVSSIAAYIKHSVNAPLGNWHGTITNLSPRQVSFQAVVAAARTASTTRTIADNFIVPMDSAWSTEELFWPEEGKWDKIVCLDSHRLFVGTIAQGCAHYDSNNSFIGWGRGIFETAVGSMNIFAPSGCAEFDYFENGDLTKRLTCTMALTQSDATYLAHVINSFCLLWEVDFLGWVTDETREAHPGKEFSYFLRDLLEQARHSQRETMKGMRNSLIVIEADRVAGLVPFSSSRSTQDSVGESDGTNFSHTVGRSLSDSRTWTNCTSNSKVSSKARTIGLTTGKTTSGSADATKSWSTSIARGLTADSSLFQRLFPSIGMTVTGIIGGSLAGTVGWSKSESSSNSTTQTVQDTVSKSLAIGRSETKTESISHGKNKTTTTSRTSTSTVTHQIQYPQEFSAVIELASSVNRQVRADDPIILLLYRNVEPVVVESVLERISEAPPLAIPVLSHPQREEKGIP